ncbi:MAG: DUF3786 domain-containing protein [Candidatus Methanofastidiosia archaeon]
MTDELWTWDNCMEKIKSLRNRLGFSDEVEFLKLRVNLKNGKVYDKLQKKFLESTTTIYWLLTHYSEAVKTPPAGRLLKYRQLPQGHLKDPIFRLRGEKLIASIFGKDLNLFMRACEYFGGVKRELGDASFEIKSLPLIPITVILWEEGEFPSEAALLFDENASSYLHTEDLFTLGLLFSSRLCKAREMDHET